MWVSPVVLEGEFARLEPLEERHAAGLLEAGRDPAVWEHLLWAPLESIDHSRAYIASALSAARDGSSFPFAIIHKPSGAVAGSTRYLEIRPEHRALEIGWTWIGAPWWRTALNTQCKLLLMQHAFETLRANRMQFKTDILNVRSQRAIERLGAKKEGVLRAHTIRRDGTLRDSVYYSVIAPEWPAVKARLEQGLAQTDPPQTVEGG